MVKKLTSTANDFLTGGGEMGELIRAYDWESSSLGDPANWPQSLKTCVRIILTSSQPMFVWWGKDLINIYNDAYKTIVRGKHPEALGQPASVVWKEIWHEVGPRTKIVLNENIGTYDESLLLIMERNGYPEETYYTFSYSPIAGEKGGVDGIICANTDTTERIIGERQLRTLRDLGKNIQGQETALDVYKKTIEVLNQNQQDFPFAFIYQLEKNGTVANLAGKTANIDNEKITPASITIDDKAPWSFGEAIRTLSMLVNDDLSQYGRLPTGPWELPASKALVIPIAKPGQQAAFGILVVGLNPYRLPDEIYKSFFQLLVDQVASSIATVLELDEERKRAEALAEIDKAKTTFFSNISHEFRTPLTLMLGPLEDLLHDDQQLSEPHKRIVSTTHRNAIRLLRLVNALLDFSRIESGRINAHYQRTDICAFTNDLASNFRSVMEKAGLEFRVKCEKIKSPVYIDKEMWEKIVLNLLSNAFKYTLEGKITITLREKNGQVELKIEDTGVGIPDKELPMMFERFHRIQNSAGRSHEGTGIGLSLVKELVKFHHGNISVTSKEGKGSTFTVLIPVGKAHLPASYVSENETNLSGTFSHAYIQEAINLSEDISPQIEAEENIFSSNGHTIQSTVLIVDDNTDMRNYLTSLLDKQFIVQIAKNGQDALEKINRHMPDIVVSDLMMPVMDGVAMTKTIKANEATQSLPVILLSARAGEEEKMEGYETGADDYLVKPFSAKELIARIKTQLKITRIHKQQNEAIIRSEQGLRDIITQAPVGMAILKGPDYIFEIANDDYFIIAGKTKSQVIGKPLLVALPEVGTQGIKELLDTVVATGKPYIGNEYPVMIDRFGKQQLTYFNFVYQPIRDIEGKINSIMVVASDVTPQVLAKNYIMEAEENSRLAIEAADLGSYTIDLVTGQINSTDRFTEMFGFDGKGPVVHQDLIDSINPEFKEIREIAHENALKTGFMNYEAKFTGPDKKTRWLRLSGRLFFDEHKNPLRILGISMDITEQRELQQRKDDFIHMASHELKTPVTSIKGYIQLLLSMVNKKDGPVIPAAIIQSSLMTVDKQVIKLTRLMSELLDLSRIESGKLDLSNELINLNELVEDVALDILYTNTKHTIKVKHDYHCHIYGDKDRLAQVFINIINNAIKYSPAIEKVDIRIYKEEKNQVAISIKDYGIGIAQASHERIFERFFRAEGKNEQTYPGFGIGLFIAKDIIERHGGTIRVVSEKEKGSEFIILLPCDKDVPGKNE